MMKKFDVIFLKSLMKAIELPPEHDQKKRINKRHHHKFAFFTVFKHIDDNTKLKHDII